MILLVTGGAGFIGSHTVLALLEAGHEVLVLDNLSTGVRMALERVALICGRAPRFIEGDIRDAVLLDRLFCEHGVDAVLHFAGLKSVSESLEQPFAYYDNNVAGTMTLCQVMSRAGVFRLVFSSSAAVYGTPTRMPVREDCPAKYPSNPYGRSKLIGEDFLRDLAIADPRWSVGVLRYFNPGGAHESGMIGEAPVGRPTNLIPLIGQVGLSQLPRLTIFGDDYPTPDGTGIRDYIHVSDLAAGHLKALDAITATSGVHVWNLGNGIGYSVLQVIHAFEEAIGRKLPYEVVERRPGDVAECWADPSRAEADLGWTARRGLEDIVTDSWRWQSSNPDGYC